MKEFLKYTCATVVGLFIYGIIQTILFVLCLIGMAIPSASSETAKIDSNSVLVINLKGELKDRVQEDGNPFSELMAQMNGLGSSDAQVHSLADMVTSIKKAKENDNIKGIYIEAGAISAEPASLCALRNALKDFRTSKKFIVAYGEQYSQGAYYIASVADKVWMNPSGTCSWHGLGAQPQYMRDFLAKFGVKMQVIKVGKFKSATETYTEDHMSDANREQITRYITGIWGTMTKDVSESRKISVDSLNSYADRVLDFESVDVLKSMKMIDGTFYADEVKAEVKKMLKIDADDDINQVTLSTMASIDDDSNKGDDEIAIYYCEGDIVQEEAEGLILGDAGIVGPKVCKDLEKLTNDDDVKAVVLRINSGGGSAYASEQMWHQIMKLKAKKPVVVSMGGMAASGGYYMSCCANWIVAEPTTITGSIGIFGTLPDVSGLMNEKLGFHYDEAKTNKNSTMSLVSIARPMNDYELSVMQKYINNGYSLFRKRVADGRKMKIEQVEEIAQGRVWLGCDAIKIKLVDQLGSLKDAVAKAAALAKTTDYHTSNYPGKADWKEELLNKSKEGTGSYLDAQLRASLGEYYAPFMYLKNIRQRTPVQARLEYVFRIND